MQDHQHEPHNFDDLLGDQNWHYPGRANSTGDNLGHDYGTDIGWALEYNAAPLVDQRAEWHHPTPIVPGPSAAMSLILMLAAVCMLRRKP